MVVLPIQPPNIIALDLLILLIVKPSLVGIHSPITLGVVHFAIDKHNIVCHNNICLPVDILYMLCSLVLTRPLGNTTYRVLGNFTVGNGPPRPPIINK